MVLPISGSPPSTRPVPPDADGEAAEVAAVVGLLAADGLAAALALGLAEAVVGVAAAVVGLPAAEPVVGAAADLVAVALSSPPQAASRPATAGRLRPSARPRRNKSRRFRRAREMAPANSSRLDFGVDGSTRTSLLSMDAARHAHIPPCHSPRNGALAERVVR
jgi:hypothetical protein